VGEIVQRKRVFARDGMPSFDFLGGATVILDAAGGVRYIIRKRVNDDARLRRQTAFVTNNALGMWKEGPGGRQLPNPQPFRFLHDKRMKDAKNRPAESS
jgi:hypothetical protein